MKMACGRVPVKDADLASQLTLLGFENSVIHVGLLDPGCHLDSNHIQNDGIGPECQLDKKYD